MSSKPPSLLQRATRQVLQYQVATDSRAAGTAVDWPCWCPVAVEDVSREHLTLLSRARPADPHCTAIWNIPARFAQSLFVASEDHCSLEEPERGDQDILHNQDISRKLLDTQAAPLEYWNGFGGLTVQIVGGGFQPRGCCGCRASAKPHYILVFSFKHAKPIRSVTAGSYAFRPCTFTWQHAMALGINSSGAATRSCITFSLSLAGRSRKGSACTGMEDQLSPFQTAQNMPCVYLSSA